ncbi:MAG TPA: hypothetical protein VM490_23500 [Armatimonadaceae bacterium]|nr:hypothetical protein [Armatimonadaceae bacterium]
MRRSDDGGNKGSTGVGDGALDEGFLGRTYRSTLVLALFGAFYLWAYGLTWALLPAAAGVALALSMLWVNDVGLRRGLRAAGKNSGSGLSVRAITGVALIKYALVAPLLWLIVRYWDLRALGAFACGVSLVPTNIALRVVSRCLTASGGNGTSRPRSGTSAPQGRIRTIR